MNGHKIIPALVQVILLLLILTGCRSDKISVSRPLLGTIVNITVNSERKTAVEAINSAFTEIERIQALFSTYSYETDIARLNREGGQSMVELTPEVYELLKLSVDISSQTSGSFDVTFASLSSLWNFRADKFVPPSGIEIQKKLKYVGYENLLFEDRGNTAGFKMKGVRADMGGIAKGYAISKAVQMLKKHGITTGFVDAGGDIQVIGENIGKSWIVGVKDPTGSGIIGTLDLSGEDSVATSGAYERYREYNGKKYHHIINPKSGYPADSGLISVSVVCSDPVLADAYATAFFVMGFNKTAEFLIENKSISVILVDDKGEIFVSKVLEGKVEFKEQYTIQYF